MLLKKHDRIVNVQNRVTIGKDTKDEYSYAEPNACRKQVIRRHLKSHGANEAAQIAKKSNDQHKLNKIVALSRVGMNVPNYRIPQTDINLLFEACEYAKNHQTNPVTDGTIHLRKGTIRNHVIKMSQNYQDQLYELIDQHFEAERAAISLNQEPKWILSMSTDMDHVRISGENYGAQNLVLRTYDLTTQESKVFSILANLFQVQSTIGGKTSAENILQLRSFFDAKFKKEYIKSFALSGDMGVIKEKFFHELEMDKNADLKFLKFTSSMCTNHAVPLLEKHTMVKSLNNAKLLLKFSNMFPKSKVKDGDKITFWGDSNREKEFSENMDLFFSLIKIQSETDKSHVTFSDHLDAIQKEFIRKKSSKKLESVEETIAIDSSLVEETVELCNPHACHHVEEFRAEFFKDSKKSKPKIYKVQPTADLKQRRLVTIYQNMVGASQYAIMILKTAEAKDFKVDEIFNNFGPEFPLEDVKFSTAFLHNISEYIAMQQYIKAEADSTVQSYNMPLFRFLNISFKCALRYDCKQKLPLSNHFTT